MLGSYCRDLGDYILGDFSLRLARFGIQTWMMNLCALIFALGSSYSLYFFNKHYIYIPLILLFITYIFHYMDCSISDARHFYGKHSTRYHEILYNLSDILSEVIFFSGFALSKYVTWRYSIVVMATYTVLTTLGILVYNKRVFDLDESYFDRSDRFIILAVFLILLKQYTLCLVIISLINIIGIIQRLVALIITKQPKLI